MIYRITVEVLSEWKETDSVYINDDERTEEDGASHYRTIMVDKKEYKEIYTQVKEDLSLDAVIKAVNIKQ